MALLPGGGQAELAVAHETHVLPVPDALTWEEAGGFVEAFATAHDALFAQAELAAGERLLVNGAAGGVGVAAVQLGLAAGATVTANARHHHDELRALGADTDVEGEYDVILELVGGENLATNLERLALKGRISVIGTGAGRARDRVRLPDAEARPNPRLDAPRALDGGEGRGDCRTRRVHGRAPVQVPVEESFPLERTQDAYERFRAGNKFGKIVVCPATSRRLCDRPAA